MAPSPCSLAAALLPLFSRSRALFTVSGCAPVAIGSGALSLSASASCPRSRLGPYPRCAHAIVRPAHSLSIHHLSPTYFLSLALLCPCCPPRGGCGQASALTTPAPVLARPLLAWLGLHLFSLAHWPLGHSVQGHAAPLALVLPTPIHPCKHPCSCFALACAHPCLVIHTHTR